MTSKITQDQYNTLKALKSAIEKHHEDIEKYFQLALKIVGIKDTANEEYQDPNIDPMFSALYEKETSLDNALFDLDIKVMKDK